MSKVSKDATEKINKKSKGASKFAVTGDDAAVKGGDYHDHDGLCDYDYSHKVWMT